VNLHGVMNTTHAVLPGMCERGFGRLITISSGAGSIGLSIGVSPYGAAKAAGTSFMRHMAIENARLGVTANSLALGLMEMTDITDADLVATLAKTVPKGRLGTGADIGPAVVWLASNEAEWVTGQTIHVNGGGVTT
jgi:NAD(P)-dependent dehydrogenase (short-subunit alcohol dehydrogenase family)